MINIVKKNISVCLTLAPAIGKQALIQMFYRIFLFFTKALTTDQA